MISYIPIFAYIVLLSSVVVRTILTQWLLVIQKRCAKGIIGTDTEQYGSPKYTVVAPPYMRKSLANYVTVLNTLIETTKTDQFYDLATCSIQPLLPWYTKQEFSCF